MNTDKLRKALETELSELQQRFEHLKADVIKEHSSDSAEQAQERENDEVLDVIGAETRNAIIELQAALQRMEDGNYGLCEGCGDSIGEARLQARPSATLCIDCAS